MRFQVHYKNLKPSEYLEAYARQKLSPAISKFCSKPRVGKIDFEINHGEHLVKCRFLDDRGHPIIVHVNGDDMYQCLDLLALKLDNALRRSKERMKSHRVHHHWSRDSEVDGFDLYDESDSLRNGIDGMSLLA
ncbi:MAG: HPF/RaiA family ribosome-associated protein [Bdellovibrionota bacterium]